MYRVFIDDSGVHIQQDGVDIATFAKRTLITPYVRAGDRTRPACWPGRAAPAAAWRWCAWKKSFKEDRP